MKYDTNQWPTDQDARIHGILSNRTAFDRTRYFNSVESYSPPSISSYKSHGQNDRNRVLQRNSPLISKIFRGRLDHQDTLAYVLSYGL